MHIIDKDGNIVEGQALTPEEVLVMKELTEDHGLIYGASSSYIPSRDIAKIAKVLIANFHITRRVNAEVATEEVCLEASHE